MDLWDICTINSVNQLSRCGAQIETGSRVKWTNRSLPSHAILFQGFIYPARNHVHPHVEPNSDCAVSLGIQLAWQSNDQGETTSSAIVLVNKDFFKRYSPSSDAEPFHPGKTVLKNRYIDVEMTPPRMTGHFGEWSPLRQFIDTRWRTLHVRRVRWGAGNTICTTRSRLGLPSDERSTWGLSLAQEKLSTWVRIEPTVTHPKANMLPIKKPCTFVKLHGLVESLVDQFVQHFFFISNYLGGILSCSYWLVWRED